MGIDEVRQLLVGPPGELIAVLKYAALAVSLCLLRFACAMMVFPPTSGQAFTGMSRNAICAVLAAFAAFGQSPQLFERLQGVTLVLALLREAGIGLALGYAAGTIFWVAQNVGTMIDTASGFNNIQVANPQRGEQNTPVSDMLGQLASTLFFVLGGMMVLVGLIFDSFKWWPIGADLPDATRMAAEFVIHQSDTMMQLTIKLATPVVLCLVLVDVCMGFVSRVGGNIDTHSLANPIKGALTLMLLALFIGVFFDQLRSYLSLSEFARVVTAFGQHQQR